MIKRIFTSESVTEGHPDKVCDQISDAILDDMLAQDPHSHVAVETCATVGQFFVFGEVTSEGYSDIQNIVRSVAQYFTKSYKTEVPKEFQAFLPGLPGFPARPLRA